MMHAAILLVTVLCVACVREADPQPSRAGPNGEAEASVAAPLGKATSATLGIELTLLQARRASPDTLQIDLAVSPFNGGGGAATEDPMVRARTSLGESCVLTSTGHRLFLLRGAANEPVLQSADWPARVQRGFVLSFPAPPVDVDRITLVIPGFPPFRDVKVGG